MYPAINRHSLYPLPLKLSVGINLMKQVFGSRNSSLITHEGKATPHQLSKNLWFSQRSLKKCLKSHLGHYRLIYSKYRQRVFPRFPLDRREI
jgi:hypothetical protein